MLGCIGARMEARTDLGRPRGESSSHISPLGHGVFNLDFELNEPPESSLRLAHRLPGLRPLMVRRRLASGPDRGGPVLQVGRGASETCFGNRRPCDVTRT